MALPYERQIVRLLRELTWYQMLAAHCRRDRAQYGKELQDVCREIERALRKWRKNSTAFLYSGRRLTYRTETGFSCRSSGDGGNDGLAEKKGWEAIGEYLEACIMEEVLDLLDM